MFYVPILYKYGYQSKPTKKDPDVKYIAPFGADPVNSMLCVATTTTPLCDTVNMGSLLKFLIKNMLSMSLLISNDPVITALPENGNPVPDPPAFSAYDAVNEYDDDNEFITLLTVTGNVVPLPRVNVIVELLTDAVFILVNECDAVLENDADVAKNAYDDVFANNAYDADSAHDAVPKNEPVISYDPVGSCDILNINFPRLIAPISL
jgi:hypothetical protein